MLGKTNIFRFSVPKFAPAWSAIFDFYSPAIILAEPYVITGRTLFQYIYIQTKKYNKVMSLDV